MIIMELNIKHQSDLLKNNYVYGSKEIYNNDIVDTSSRPLNERQYTLVLTFIRDHLDNIPEEYLCKTSN